MKSKQFLAYLCRISLSLAVMVGSFQVISFAATKSKAAAKNNSSQTALWQQKLEDNLPSRGRRLIVPEKYLVYGLNQNALKEVLAQAPDEFSDAARSGQTILEVPTPDGKIARFRIEESVVMAPEIAAQFPDWKTYQGYGIDDPTAIARFDFTKNGFHGQVLSPRGTYLVDPYQDNDLNNYIVYQKHDHDNSGSRFHCKLDEQLNGNDSPENFFTVAPQFAHGTQIRNYRLAVATTGEYTAFFGSQAAALSQVVTTVNRINGIYRREFAVSFTLVSGINLIYNTTNETPANYNNNGSSADLNANQTNVDSILGAGAYDIGHLFETGDGGIAQLRSVCGSSKARGLSGLPNPVGDPFDVDYVAHEMGHQFGANHTFNAAGNCGSSGQPSRMEAGSAVTIMGYAGICNSNANLQRNSIDNFHVYNMDEAISFINSTGSTCGTVSGVNTVPIVTAPTEYTIPYETPFSLTATATDLDGDALTYSWEQYNAGGTASSYPSSTDDDDINLFDNRPLMRPYAPTSSPTRVFPSMQYVLNNANEAPVLFNGTSSTGSLCAASRSCITGEDLPSVARTMNFRVAVRDNKGGVSDAGTVVKVINTSTPFRVTVQNTATAWTGNSSQIVTWDVSSTNVAPIGVTDVKISLSTDGGLTFPIVLSATTANDGSEAVNIPNLATSQARIKVEAVGNIFFDVNNVDFTINAGPSAVAAPFDFDGDGKSDISVFRPASGSWFLLGSQAGFTGTNFGIAADKLAPADFDGDGKTDIGVFRNGAWYYINSSNGTFTAVNFGAAGDLPRPGDFDGDAKADLAVFRPSNGTWYWLNSSNGAFNGVQFGSNGDIPLIANFDGDNKSDLAVFRPSNGGWYSINSTNGAVRSLSFGTNGDIPSVGDFDGDNKSDISVFRPSEGAWYRINSSDSAFVAIQFGTNGDIPAVGNFDGDNKSDITVFRPSTGSWYILQSQNGFTGLGFGQNLDKPIPSSFNSAN